MQKTPYTMFRSALGLCGSYRAVLQKRGPSGPGGQKASIKSACKDTIYRKCGRLLIRFLTTLGQLVHFPAQVPQIHIHAPYAEVPF
jgi:hypothetical protein